METLTIKHQIKILKKAKAIYDKEFFNGMCAPIFEAFITVFPGSNMSEMPPCFIIPIFTPEEIKSLCKKYELEPPYNNIDYSTYWWPTEERETRKLVFDALINELKIQL